MEKKTEWKRKCPNPDNNPNCKDEISYTIKEKQLSEKIQSMIYTEIRMVCQDKEKEILMNIWIDKLNEIVTDFEKLKKVNPKEFNIQINEISKTIELFKLKLQK